MINRTLVSCVCLSMVLGSIGCKNGESGQKQAEPNTKTISAKYNTETISAQDMIADWLNGPESEERQKLRAWLNELGWLNGPESEERHQKLRAWLNELGLEGSVVLWFISAPQAELDAVIEKFNIGHCNARSFNDPDAAGLRVRIDRWLGHPEDTTRDAREDELIRWIIKVCGSPVDMAAWVSTCPTEDLQAAIKTLRIPD